MKKTIGICLFTVFFVALTICGILIWRTQRETQHEKYNHIEETTEGILVSDTSETEQPKTAESMAIDEGYRFFLRESDGMLVVYDVSGENVLFETYINTQSLDDETVEQLEKGIYVRDEGELYDILESYSS